MPLQRDRKLHIFHCFAVTQSTDASVESHEFKPTQWPMTITQWSMLISRCRGGFMYHVSRVSPLDGTIKQSIDTAANELPQRRPPISARLMTRVIHIGTAKSYVKKRVNTYTMVAHAGIMVAERVVISPSVIQRSNLWLGRGSMFVLSEEQARRMLRPARSSSEGTGAVVDIGAGDGEVSHRLARLYSDRYATEISASMRKALSSKGYTLLDTEDWWREKQFDCVCMMNLLDRCSKPMTMLRQAKTAIAPGGVLLLALVLPYKPYVEGATFEEQLASFITFMATAGFEMKSWARVPYLCEGDFAQAYYWLDDSVYVFTPTTIEASV
ncbi:unnamed protein product [Chilo suppressalis]|uniref:Methyltransferase-like protein 9 n=1 Tax=Chilo suppressalis TaxID=168631 RepID=A0ABN8L5J7_CHISP|nr:unnamed protein product [Chilo suppressalis]